MYARTKTFKNKDGSTRTYLQICETRRENGKVRQVVGANLGRLEELQEGALDILVASLGKYWQLWRNCYPPMKLQPCLWKSWFLSWSKRAKTPGGR